MARTHKEVRLRKPPNGTPKVSAINGKDLKLLTVHISNPAGDVCRFSVPGIHHWISIRGQPGLTSRKLFQSAERQPRLIARLPTLNDGGKEVTDDGYGKNQTDDTVQKHSELH
jgi:hypothetical protein